VREIYVGSLEAFPTSAFPPADYMALGHIHQPQKVGGLEHIRYSGSPIALSFDEARQSKQMLLVDLGPEGLQAVTPLPVPCFQPMASVAGSLAALPDLMRAAAQAGSPARPVWLEVVVEQDDYLPQLTDRVQALADELPVELRVRRQRGRAVAGMAAAAGESLHEISPADVFERRLALETLEPGLAQALTGATRRWWPGLMRPSQAPATRRGGPRMKILTLRLKNLNSLKGEWRIDFTQAPFAATACSPSPGPRARASPPCSMPSAWRCTTRRRA
jgi:exonuclease SbcD